MITTCRSDFDSSYSVQQVRLIRLLLSVELSLTQQGYSSFPLVVTISPVVDPGRGGGKGVFGLKRAPLLFIEQ